MVSSAFSRKFTDAKLKSFELMTLEEVISRQLKIECVTWLLVITLMHIYNKKKQVEHGKV